MSNCESCPSNGNCGKNADECGKKFNPNNNIKKVIGIMSGKGGVGKSTVCVMLAQELKKHGYKVGILDADIMGPSVCRLTQIESGTRAFADEIGIIPVETSTGIKVISLNLMLDDENKPVVWRGALLSSAVTQFWEEVNWGELDFLLLDMPPGTGDITLTVMQTIPLSGVIMVSVPQDMVSMIVSKSINMAKLMDVPIIGLVQNMSYIKCPHCDEKIYLYDKDETAKMLKNNDIKLLGELPTTIGISSLEKKGYIGVEKEIADIVKNISEEFEN